MALVVVCGQPCSGKSTAAASLVRALELSQLPFTIKLIDETLVGLDRNASYQDMPHEKNLRGVLRSAVDRAVSKDAIVIIDSLNNIKGYRYELWCLARAASTRYCVLCCDVGAEDCRTWNTKRLEQGLPSYSEVVFEDLVRRFERPDQRNRWDSPLFELRAFEGEFSETSPAIMEAVSFLKGEGETKRRNYRVLQPTIATQTARTSDTNSLYEMDRATQDVITALMDAQAQALGGNVKDVDLGDGLPMISLDRTIALPELRRHRRTFIKLTGQASLSGRPPPSDATSAKRMFAEYLNRELQA